MGEKTKKKKTPCRQVGSVQPKINLIRLNFLTSAPKMLFPAFQPAAFHSELTAAVHSLSLISRKKKKKIIFICCPAEKIMCVITQKGDGGLLSGWAVQQWAKFNSTQSRGRDRRPLFCRPSPRARSSDSHWTRRPTADGGTGAGAGVHDERRDTERWVCCHPSWRPCRPQTAHWRGAGSSQGPPPPASDWVSDMGGGGTWLDSAAKKDSMQKKAQLYWFVTTLSFCITLRPLIEK